MSKLSFRARALDATKAMPVFRSEEIPDLPDFQAINRAVPQMPTGMEKEEECEHHLQRAISAQQTFGHTGELVIPTPECVTVSESYYNDLYPANYKSPRQLIFVQPFAIDKNLPDYDIDSEDELWLTQQREVLNIDTLKFEEIIECLERNSGQHVVELNEAKKLITEHDVIVSAVYDYWLSKRLKVQHPLIHVVRTEKRDGPSNNNPYVAFRRRTEKMQTRKNRKNDEASYEKMLKLKRDLSKAVTLFEMVQQRERLKSEHLKLTIEIFDKRYRIGDFNGQVLAEVSALKHIKPASSYLSAHQHTTHRVPGDRSHQKDDVAPKKRHEYKRKHKQDSSRSRPELVDHHDYVLTSDDETGQGLQSDQDEDDPDGPYAFRRTAGCSYQAPLPDHLGNWPWTGPEEGGSGDPRFRFSLSSFSTQPNPVFSYVRRRIGRGGRIIFDRIKCPTDDLFLKEPLPAEAPVSGSSSSQTDCEAAEKQYELDEEGNPIPVVQIPLSDLISSSGVVRYCSTVNSEPPLPSFCGSDQRLRPESVDFKETGCGTPSQNRSHSAPVSSLSALTPASAPKDSMPSKTATLDEARAQMAVSAVYNNSMPATPDSVPLVDGVKKSRLNLSESVLSNGPDSLNTMH